MQHDLTEKKELNPEQVVLAYANGYFPMAEEAEDSVIYWHKPKKRAVFILKKFELRKSLIKLLEAETFTFTINTAFDSVIDGCADRDSTWISEEILEVYKKTLLVVIPTGLVLSVLLYFASGQIAEYVFKKPSLEPYFRIISFAVLPMAMRFINSECYRGFRMNKEYAYSQNVSYFLYSAVILGIP